MADAYGLNDYSLLSGDNAGTARMIQGAFDRNAAAQQRQMDRYNLTAQTSPGMVAENIEDRALGRAQTTAGILNQNQQLQHIIDASHRTPHGLGENLSAYLPAVGALSRLAPFLFGTDATSAFGRGGLFGAAKSGIDKVASWFKDPNTGSMYGMDSTGKVVGAYDSSGNWIGGNNMGWGGVDNPWGMTGSNANWPSAGGGMDFGSDFGASPGIDWSSAGSGAGGDLFGWLGD